MFKRFYPDIYIDSAYDIDYQGLYDKGYRGIVFDIDNTLVEHGAPVTKRCSDLFDRLRTIGFETCIISNNKEYRVKPLADACGSRYVSKAGKPSHGEQDVQIVDDRPADVLHTFPSCG